MAVTIAEEGFTTTGLMVTERNWLDVYPYANWGGNANLPVFQQGQQFFPQEIHAAPGPCLQSTGCRQRLQMRLVFEPSCQLLVDYVGYIGPCSRSRIGDRRMLAMVLVLPSCY